MSLFRKSHFLISFPFLLRSRLDTMIAYALEWLASSHAQRLAAGGSPFLYAPMISPSRGSVDEKKPFSRPPLQAF